MRFHVVSLPHTQTTRAYSACAFTEKTRKFCMMMTKLGHHVTLYSGVENEAPCNEHVSCIDEATRLAAVGDGHYTSTPFGSELPHWKIFNTRVIAEMYSRVQPRDFICVIGGHPHKPIADAFPQNMTVEFGIGYGGFFADYRVFESYAWMHTCYGARAVNGDPCAVDGRWFDAVIPGYFDPDEFPEPERAAPREYYLFVGRLIKRKGFQTAIDACKHMGARLVVAGPGDASQLPSGVEYVGVVDAVERAKLMSGAKALFAPTEYIEPFGNVAVEAMACGTPVIATDWGAFTETVQYAPVGYLCRTLGEFVNAGRHVDKEVTRLDRMRLREYAFRRYQLDVIGKEYENYFHRLWLLWSDTGDGWYTVE